MESTATLNVCVCESKAEAKGLQLDEELRYLQRKKLVRELDSTRLKVSALFFNTFLHAR